MTTEITTTLTWSPRLEEYLSTTGEKAYCLSVLHKSAEQRYSRLTIWIDLPTIILSTINGATSIGSNSLFGDSPLAPIVIGAIALLTALLSTIGSYFSWARRAEGHRISSLQYEKLYRFLAIELSVPRNERMQPSDLVKYTREQYDRLKETSPLLPSEAIVDFKKRFDKPEYADVAKPSEANGIEKIVVYNAPTTPGFGSMVPGVVPLALPEELARPEAEAKPEAKPVASASARLASRLAH